MKSKQFYIKINNIQPSTLHSVGHIDARGLSEQASNSYLMALWTIYLNKYLKFYFVGSFPQYHEHPENVFF